MQAAGNPQNADELRILGLISFVSILVGCAIGVFDAELWLVDHSSVRTNALIYTMGAFTLQGLFSMENACSRLNGPKSEPC